MDLHWLHVRYLLPDCPCEINLMLTFLKILTCWIHTGFRLEGDVDASVMVEKHLWIYEDTWLWRPFWWQGMMLAELQKWVKWHNISCPENYSCSLTFTVSELVFLGRPTWVSLCSSKLSCIALWHLQLFTQIVLVRLEIISAQVKDFMFWELRVH